MFRRLSYYWSHRPLIVIMLLASLVRLLAVLFSKGFGMHDDHFLVIEAAQAWADGTDYNNWLPGFSKTGIPDGHSLFYPGLHYLLFSFFNWIHFTDPQGKMYIVRLIHAAFSLLTVYFGYRVALRLSNEKTARMTGVLLAVSAFLPYYSVRNLVEMVCIPFLVMGLWLILIAGEKKHNRLFLATAGILLGLAFSVRFQTLVFAGGVGLALLVLGKWREMLWAAAGFLLSVALVQGVTDICIWGYPFAELMEYVKYNLREAHSYITSAWYTYILFLLGMLIPPVSLFLFSGFLGTFFYFRMMTNRKWHLQFRLSTNWKKYFVIFLPVFLFLLFHSVFPNKQERFILPVVPFIVILGMTGWNEYVGGSFFWQKRRKLLFGCWTFFWIMNVVFLLVLSTWYSKKARVESMTYLSKYKNVKCILLEDSNTEGVKIPPEFYLGQWISVGEVTAEHPAEEYAMHLDTIAAEDYPRFVLFCEDRNLGMRVARMKQLLPDLKYEASFAPGFVDRLLYRINPMNSNFTIHVYRNDRFFGPELKEAP